MQDGCCLRQEKKLHRQLKVYDLAQTQELNLKNIFKTKLKDDRIDEFNLPAPGEYIGTHIEGDLGGVKVANKSYKNYYKKMI